MTLLDRIGLGLGVMLLAGCAHLETVPCAMTSYGLSSPMAQPGPPAAGKALIIFFQEPALCLMNGGCGHLPAAFPPSVFHISGEEVDFIGFVDVGNKVAYEVPAGDQVFMRSEEGVEELIAAHMTAGMTYYVEVLGGGAGSGLGACSSMFPCISVVRRAELADRRTIEKLADSAFFGPNDKARDWFEHNRAKLEAKLRRAREKWTRYSEEQRAKKTLNVDDGNSESLYHPKTTTAHFGNGQNQPACPGVLEVREEVP